MTCDTVLERIARGDWEGDQGVAAHLGVCPECRVRVGSAEALGRHLRDPLFWEEAPERLRDDVVAAVVGESSSPKRRPRWWFLGAAAVLVLVVVAAVNLAAGPDWYMRLEPGAEAPQATATVAGWNMDYGTKMMVEVAGLQPTGSDSYYELWLTAPDGRHVSAGTFRQSGRFEMMAGVRRAEFPRLWITLEPADDDPAPFPMTVLDTPEI